MENSEDMLKIDKKLVTKKIGSNDHFLAKNFFAPGKAKNVSRVLVLVAGLFTFQVPDVSIDASSRNMIRNKAKISTHKHNSNGALYVLLRYCSTFGPLFSLFLGCHCFLGFLDFFILSF